MVLLYNRRAQRGKMKKTAIFCLLGLLFSLKTSAQEDQEYTDPYQLIKVVIQKARENDKLKNGLLIFDKTEIAYELDEFGNRKPGKPISEEKTPQGKGRESKPLPLDMNLVLESSYNVEFNLNKVQFLDGESVYAVNFSPKNRFAGGQNGYYKAANRASGIVYINKKHLYAQRIEAEMAEPFNIYAGLGRLRAAKFTFEQKMIPDLNNLVVINRFEATVRYRYLVKEKHEKYIYIYNNYQLAY